MRRILLTGMSGVGKSTVAVRLVALGHRTVDVDHDGPAVLDERGRTRWDLDGVRALLASEDPDVLFVIGTDERQGELYDAFDVVALLSAPREVVAERLATRTTSPFARDPHERAQALADLDTYEPMLRRGADVEIDTDRPLDEVIEEVLALIDRRAAVAGPRTCESPRVTATRERIVRALAAAGCIAPVEEADELLRAADAGLGDLDEMLARRERGEPLAWIVGSVDFSGLRIRVDPGVYVPRPQTEDLARRAAELLPDHGIGVDLCTGSGAVAVVMATAHPHATVVATDRDPAAVACAEANGVTTFLGDLDEPLPLAFARRVDVLTAVVPYVPTDDLHLLPRDVVAYEPPHALDGGERGVRVLDEVARRSVRWLAPTGRLLLELGGGQPDLLAPTLEEVGLTASRVHRDADGDARAIEAWAG
ncbi:MAG TPA: HemK family protein methyltransferase [Actinomycetota bacterium]